jgi:hypothetical protein
MQPEREFDSNKRKQMKINDSKIAFFYLRLFLRIRTFQWVAPDSNKISSPFIWNSLWLYWRGTHSSYRSTARSEGLRQSSLASPLILTKISALRKKLLALSSRRVCRGDFGGDGGENQRFLLACQASFDPPGNRLSSGRTLPSNFQDWPTRPFNAIGARAELWVQVVV